MRYHSSYQRPQRRSVLFTAPGLVIRSAYRWCSRWHDGIGPDCLIERRHKRNLQDQGQHQHYWGAHLPRARAAVLLADED